MTITAARSPFRHEPGLDFAAPEEDERFEEALARVRSQLGRTYPLVIGGTEVDRGETFASLNPARPAEVIGHHAAATLDDVDAAIAAAGEAFADWSQTHAEERAALLFDVADRIVERRRDFAALLTLEVGKIREEADGEIAEVADVLRWYAQQMLDLDRPRPLLPVDGEQTSLVYVPLGVGAIVSPWNFPLSLTTGMMSAALVAGNTVVVKPASASATSAAWLVDLFRESGAPAGVINLLTGSGGLIGDALVDHPQTRFVAFTGSKDVGVRINERAARLQPGQIWIKRVQLELGGKNAILVDETAALERAAEAIVTSAFGYQGRSARRARARSLSTPSTTSSSCASSSVRAGCGSATRPSATPTSVRWSTSRPSTKSSSTSTSAARRVRSCSAVVLAKAAITSSRRSSTTSVRARASRRRRSSGRCSRSSARATSTTRSTSRTTRSSAWPGRPSQLIATESSRRDGGSTSATCTSTGNAPARSRAAIRSAAST